MKRNIFTFHVALNICSLLLCQLFVFFQLENALDDIFFFLSILLSFILNKSLMQERSVNKLLCPQTRVFSEAYAWEYNFSINAGKLELHMVF